MRARAAAAIAILTTLPLLLTWAFPPVRANAGNRGASPAAYPLPPGVALIYTAAPVYESLAALRGDERFPGGARLMLMRDGQTKPLVPGFAASADASVSFDAQTVLFAGKRESGEPWQIWKVPLGGGVPQPVLAAETDLIRPLWMPDGRLVYARRDTGRFVLETAALDGSGRLQLSYAPGSYIPDDVLHDGRILFESGFPLGSGETPEMYLVYADGSGVESVRCDHGSAREHGRQMRSGDIVFTHARRLARFTSARADEGRIAAPAGEYAGDVAEMPDGRWILSLRMRWQKHYSLSAWKPGASITVPLAMDSGHDLVEPAVVAPRAVPNRHPSALHDWMTGNLLALDARLSRNHDLATAPAAVRVETIDAAGNPIALGTAPVEKDGSFFVKTAADQPVRVILLDASGRTVREEHGWFWIRRGEQRVCVGCHAGPERAPDNRVPEVLLRTTTPVDLTGAAPDLRSEGH